MSGLVLKLGPRERIMINGVVIENGDRRARLNVLTPGANVLRLRDAIHPEEANTPSGASATSPSSFSPARPTPRRPDAELLRGIEQLSQVFHDPDSRAHLDAATKALGENRFCQALRALRCLLRARPGSSATGLRRELHPRHPARRGRRLEVPREDRRAPAGRLREERRGQA